MKQLSSSHFALAFTASLFLQVAPRAHAQGLLVPPGPPAPLFKTLEQVEPRRPIASLPYVINQPGSYYLTTNLFGVAGQNGITINAACVTIDMMGFDMVGVGGSLSGYSLAPGAQAYIYNGCIRNWGQDGVNGAGAGASAVLERLRVHANQRNGIALAGGSQVRQCVASSNQRTGISAGLDSNVDDCSVIANGQHGIQVSSGANVRRCVASANAASGITTGDGSSVLNCNATDSGVNTSGTAPGISVGGGCTVRDCTTRNNSGNGITATFGSNIANNSCRDNLGNNIEVSQECLVSQNACDDDTVNRGQSGIRVTSNNNRIDHNTVTETIRGLWITSVDNEVIGNTVLRNSTNYVIQPGNQLSILLGQIPETIPWPAYVELAGTLRGASGENGITVTTNDVTIDLKGQSLFGVGGSLSGIRVSGFRTNIVVRNGTVRNWGLEGIRADDSYNSSYSDLRVSGNGATGLLSGNGAAIKGVTVRANRGTGLFTGTGCSVTECASSENLLDGIVAQSGSTISTCSAYNNGRHGFSANSGSTVSQCSAYSNTNGIVASGGTTVIHCTAYLNATNGIIANTGSRISGCTVRLNDTGINVASDCLVVDNTCDGNDAFGLLVTSSDNRIDGNHLTDNGTGLHVSGTGNFVVRNSAAGNTTDYAIVVGNNAANILLPPAAFLTDQPWSNFRF